MDKNNILQYTPKNNEKYKDISKIVDVTKFENFIDKINNVNVSESEKEFLKLAATRHIRFNYAAIAEYYCHASKEMQEIMEELALVIIDEDDAIANGYVRFKKEINKMLGEDNNA